tara:strand:+ start:208 stop:753 length:546 start_codon:yes stop_codon:yes gene_type:complete
MRLNFFINKKQKDILGISNEKDFNEDFSNAIKLFKSRRSEMDFSLEELSIKTKISKNVLIAIENGLEKYLPEKTYLISMIKRLEAELKLEANSLDGLLMKKVLQKQQNRLEFRFININFLNTRKGNVIYIMIMLLSILAINRQQKYILFINSQSTEPIYIFNSEDTEKENNIMYNYQEENK